MNLFLPTALIQKRASYASLSEMLKGINRFAKPDASIEPLLPITAPPNKPIKNQPAFQFNIPTEPPEIHRQRQILSKFVTTLTKHGMRRDVILCRVSTKLSIKYGRPDVLAKAVDAIRPVVRFNKEPVKRKTWIPIALSEKSSIGLGIRWIIKAASEREYTDTTKRRDLERSLEDEIEAVLQGTSSLYSKRAQFHRNPN